jgi:hypothetical protein
VIARPMPTRTISQTSNRCALITNAPFTVREREWDLGLAGSMAPGPPHPIYTLPSHTQGIASIVGHRHAVTHVAPERDSRHLPAGRRHPE